MLVEIGTIVGVYAIARLLQVPLELAARPKGEGYPVVKEAATVISIFAAAAIAVLLMMLWSHRPDGPMPQLGRP